LCVVDEVGALGSSARHLRGLGDMPITSLGIS